MKAKLTFLAAAFALLVGASLASADDDSIHEALTRLPAAAPAPAFAGIEEVNMTNACRRRHRPAQYYPSAAAARSIQGDVVLDCVVGADAKLSTCQVLAVAPLHFDFERPAIQIACRFRVNPAEVADNQPVTGANLPTGTRIYRRNAEGEPWRIRTTIRFRLADLTPPR